MAETKTTSREYTIPLRRAWLNVQHYERTGKAIKAIKIFIAKHMKVADRDVDRVKLDVYLNNDLWFKGRTNPPSKVKVRAVKDGDNVNVTFVEVPDHVKFLRGKHERIHKKADKKVEAKEEKTAETVQKTEEQKTEEKEKEKAVAEHNFKEADKAAKADKHTSKITTTQRPQRMTLKK